MWVPNALVPLVGYDGDVGVSQYLTTSGLTAVTNTSGQTIYLPRPDITGAGARYTVKTGSGVTGVRVIPNTGGVVIDGQAIYLVPPGGFVTVMSDGANWSVVNSFAPPGASQVFVTTGQSIPPNVFTQLLFDGVAFDTWGAFNPVAHTWTAPVAGFARVNCYLAMGNVTTDVIAQLAIYKNGAQKSVGGTYYGYVEPITGVTMVMPEIARLADVNAGDTLTIGVQATQAAMVMVDGSREALEITMVH
jgi:hypothetical protein